MTTYASYPTSPATFTPKVDVQDTIFADNINQLQDEVYAIETTLGNTPNVSTYTGSFALTTNWSSVSARISNIERGLVNGVTGVASPYFSKAGDSITAPAGTVGLTLNAITGSTTDLIRTYDYQNNLGFNVDYTGKPKVGTYSVIYVNSTDYNNLITQITAAATAAANAAAAAAANPFSPFLLAGI